MVTVSQSVEKIIDEKPFLQEALRRGILNTAALAEEIKPLVEEMLKHEVKFSAVNMALRRQGERLGSREGSALAVFKESTDIIVRNKLISMTLARQELLPRIISALYAETKDDDFLTVTQGLREVMLIMNDSLHQRVKEDLSGLRKKKVIEDLCSITINIPEESVQAIGLFYQLTRKLAWENIPIIDVVSTYTEITILVEEQQITRAFEALRRLVRNKD